MTAVGDIPVRLLLAAVSAGRDQRRRQCQPLAGGDQRTMVYSLALEAVRQRQNVTNRSRFPIDLETLVESPS
jgi:hypothetical protein